MNKYLKLIDTGYNYVQLPITAGEHRVGVAMSVGGMSLNLNEGTWQDAAAYSGSLGAGSLVLGEDSRDLKRFSLADFTGQKAVLPESMPSEGLNIFPGNKHPSDMRNIRGYTGTWDGLKEQIDDDTTTVLVTAAGQPITTNSGEEIVQ